MKVCNAIEQPESNADIVWPNKSRSGYCINASGIRLVLSTTKDSKVHREISKADTMDVGNEVRRVYQIIDIRHGGP